MTEREEYLIRKRVRKEILEHDVITPEEISDILMSILKDEIKKANNGKIK